MCTFFSSTLTNTSIWKRLSLWAIFLDFEDLDGPIDWIILYNRFIALKEVFHWQCRCLAQTIHEMCTENITFSSVIQIQKTDMENNSFYPCLKRVAELTKLRHAYRQTPSTFIASVSNTSDLCASEKFSWVEVTYYYVCMHSSFTCFTCAICTWYVLFIDLNFIICNVILSGNRLSRYCNIKIFYWFLFQS